LNNKVTKNYFYETAAFCRALWNNGRTVYFLEEQPEHFFEIV